MATQINYSNKTVDIDQLLIIEENYSQQAIDILSNQPMVQNLIKNFGILTTLLQDQLSTQNYSQQNNGNYIIGKINQQQPKTNQKQKQKKYMQQKPISKVQLKMKIKSSLKTSELSLDDNCINELISLMDSAGYLYEFERILSQQSILDCLNDLQSRNIINPAIIQKYPSLFKILRKNIVNYQSFPKNCSHIRISYYIWGKKGNNVRDPTEIGRKIKQLSKFVQEEQ